MMDKKQRDAFLEKRIYELRRKETAHDKYDTQTVRKAVKAVRTYNPERLPRAMTILIRVAMIAFMLAIVILAIVRF